MNKNIYVDKTLSDLNYRPSISLRVNVSSMLNQYPGSLQVSQTYSQHQGGSTLGILVLQTQLIILLYIIGH